MHRLNSRHALARVFLAGLLGLAFTVPAHADSAAEIAKNQNQEWNRLFNGGKVDQLADLYAKDAIVSTADGQVYKGRDAIHGLFKGYVEGGLHNHSLEIIKAEGSGQWVYEVATWRASGAPKNAVIPFYKGIATIIFQRQDDDSWLIKSHTWNKKPNS